jgi:hypothetical protein
LRPPVRPTPQRISATIPAVPRTPAPRGPSK